MTAASRSLRRHLVGCAGPHRTQLPCEILSGRVAAARESIHTPTLMTGNLRNDVRGRAEPVEADGVGIARHAVGPVSDQAGAEQGSGFCVAVFLRQAEAIAPICNNELGIAAIEITAREVRVVAEIFHAGEAEAAMAAGPPEPRHADAFADGKIGYAVTKLRHPANHLVPGNHRILRLR